MSTSPFARLLKTLEARDHISPLEAARVEALPFRLKSYKRNEEIIAEGSRPTESCLLVEGIVGRMNYLQDGSRQVSAVHIPGDFVDLHGFLLKVMDHGINALTPCRVAYVAHPHLRDLVDAEPHLGRMLWLLTAIDAAVGRAWIACMGRRSAARHLAHLLCELYLRMEVVGLAKDGIFEFPVSQVDISDMLGLSPVHTNRVLQEMRQQGLVAWKGRKVEIKDFDALAEFGEFNPLCLNLVQEPR